MVDYENSKFNLIWYDQNMNSLENKTLSYVINEKYNLHTCVDVEEAISFLQKNSDEHFDLITSGTNGEYLCEILEAYSNVKHIIVFCINVPYHKTWAIKFPKIISVTADIFKALKELDIIHKNSIEKSEMDKIENFNPNMNMESEE